VIVLLLNLILKESPFPPCRQLLVKKKKRKRKKEKKKKGGKGKAKGSCSFLSLFLSLHLKFLFFLALRLIIEMHLPSQESFFLFYFKTFQGFSDFYRGDLEDFYRGDGT